MPKTFQFDKPSPKYSLARDGISQSLLKRYMACPRQFAIATWGWTPPPKFSMELGSAGHKALETGSTDLYEPKGMSVNQSEQITAYVHAMLPAYLKHYGAFSAEERPEYVFDVKVFGTRLRGKIDSVHAKYITEHKFNSRISEADNEARLALDFQSLFYLTALQQEGRFNPLTVRFDVIRYPTIKDATLPSDIFSKVNVEATKHPDEYFYRWETEFTEKEVFSFTGELMQKLYELRDRTIWYRNECSCVGNFRCPYLEYCRTGKMPKEYSQKPLFTELEE
jgi:hypothetical protein